MTKTFFAYRIFFFIIYTYPSAIYILQKNKEDMLFFTFDIPKNVDFLVLYLWRAPPPYEMTLASHSRIKWAISIKLLEFYKEI